MLSIRLSRPSCLSFSGFFLLALYSMSGPSQLPRVGLGYRGGGGGVGRGKVYIFDRFISWVFSVCLGSLSLLFYFGCLGLFFSFFPCLSVGLLCYIHPFPTTQTHVSSYTHWQTRYASISPTPQRRIFIPSFFFLFSGTVLAIERGENWEEQVGTTDKVKRNKNIYRYHNA